MTHTAYPTTTDLSGLLADAGITAPSSATLGGAVGWAAQQWERKTKWLPFLSPGTDQVRYFDPPGARPVHPQFLAMRGGGKLLELDTGLVTLTSLVVMNTTYILGSPGDPSGVGMYWLSPVNNPARGWPYEFIEFWTPVIGSPQSVVVTGKWGFSTTIPEDVFQSILAGAAWKIMSPAASKRSQGAAQRTQGEVSERYAAGKDAGAWAYECGLWRETWLEGIQSYRRQRFGI